MSFRIFADAASIEDMLTMAANPLVQGFTTNPTLMLRAGVRDYEAYAQAVITALPPLPISFEVCTDDLMLMEQQAKRIASWGPHVYVKIPVTTCAGASTASLVARLCKRGIPVNVTAVMTLEQIAEMAEAIPVGASAIVSIFAGRIADTGIDPVPLMVEARTRLPASAQLLWASTREAWNVYQAEACGCSIVTVTKDVLSKLALKGHPLSTYSLQTVQSLYGDACRAGLTL